MSSTNGFGGVAECYAFKSRLQEYAQKVGFTTPVYHTVMEGPSHEPIFKSTVIVNNVRYESLPGFYNRKTAEQSAAEVALMEIHKSGQMTECIPTVHETGLCKNLLQEYAQKMNFAVPSYTCKRLPSDKNSFSCTVEIGGIQYIGAAAKTKKEAEIKAARTALLAIQSSSSGRSETNGVSKYTVLPGKRKGKETEAQAETAKMRKQKKTEFKKKRSKKKFVRKNKGDAAKFKKTARFNNGEACNAEGDNQQMPEFDKSSASAMVEESKSHHSVHQSVCETASRDGHPGICNGSHGTIASAVNAHFQDRQAGELDHVGWMEENGCLNRPVNALDGCGDHQIMEISPLDGSNYHGNVSMQ